MGWFASVANWAWENRAQGKKMLPGLGIFGAVFAAVLVYGFLRLNQVPSGETIRVAGITAESAHAVGERVAEAQDKVAAARPLFQAHWDMYFAATTREAKARAQVIVWPEVAGMVFESEEAPFIARAQETARQNGVYLAVPLWIWDPRELRPLENKLLLIDPTGTIVMEHVKYGGNIIEGTLLGEALALDLDREGCLAARRSCSATS